MTSLFTPVSSGARLSDQVAQQLVESIRQGRLAAGEKLPTEARLVEQFQVSRTVIREAISRLKSRGLVDSRQGSGVFVSPRAQYVPLDFDARHSESRDAVVQLAEVRRALEAEAAGLAAQRRTAADIRRLRQAVRALDQRVRSGGDGVLEDLAFHRAIAQASHNPFLLGTLDYLAQFMQGAIGLTRANEARRADFADQVREEHAAVVEAIAAAQPQLAQQAAARHMDNAIARIRQADAAFWREEGAALRPLRAHAV